MNEGLEGAGLREGVRWDYTKGVEVGNWIDSSGYILTFPSVIKNQCSTDHSLDKIKKKYIYYYKRLPWHRKITCAYAVQLFAVRARLANTFGAIRTILSGMIILVKFEMEMK